MKVQELLLQKVGQGLSIEQSLDFLTNSYGVRVKKYDDRVVLNYSQIDSPKNDPITNECRGLILSLPDFQVMSRTFDRFYNFNEVEGQDKDLSNKMIFEKLDGSLIPIYFDNMECKWQIATRGTAFGEATLPNSTKTYKELVLEFIGFDEEVFQEYCDFFLDISETYICEICSPENRIVTPYKEGILTLLAARNKVTGEYESYTHCTPPMFAPVKSFTFNNTQHILEAVNALEGLEEGYVVYSNEGTPLYKIKSPKYVAIHLLRGDLNLSKKRLAELVLNNDHKEYLTYYPEEANRVTPYEESLNRMLGQYEGLFKTYNEAVNQKEFALSIKDLKENALYFKARAKNMSVKEVFNQQRVQYKVDTLLNFMYP